MLRPDILAGLGRCGAADLVPRDLVLERPEVITDVDAALVVAPDDLAELAGHARVLPREPRADRVLEEAHVAPLRDAGVEEELEVVVIPRQRDRRLGVAAQAGGVRFLHPRGDVEVLVVVEEADFEAGLGRDLLIGDGIDEVSQRRRRLPGLVVDRGRR